MWGYTWGLDPESTGRTTGTLFTHNVDMTLKVVVHEDSEGGYWAEVPALPGCATQGETIPELMERVKEAVEGWLMVDQGDIPEGQVYEIAV